MIDAKKTILRGGNDCTERISYLENTLDDVMLGDFEKELVEERIGKLKGGLCIVKSGGLSEVETQECRDRIEDSLFAVRAALEDGYVIGGGFALYQASQKVLKGKKDVGS
jgi:chaperonin GroEL